jgi:hypothetical protein
LNSLCGKVGEEASCLSHGCVEYAIDLGELSVVEDSEVGCMIFGFKELFDHECFVGVAQFSFSEEFCKFSNVRRDFSKMFSEVEDGVNVYPKYSLGFVRGEILDA